jgi:hypothetical protein
MQTLAEFRLSIQAEVRTNRAVFVVDEVSAKHTQAVTAVSRGERSQPDDSVAYRNFGTVYV